MRLPNRWRTERLLIRSTVLEDSRELNHICASWKDKIYMEGDSFSENYIENCIMKGDLPPIENADASDFYMMTIQDVNGRIIGFFNLYHGYPNEDTVWIGIFVIDAELQGKAFGQEIIESICDECKKLEWKSIGLGVYLKNWKGLRFWNNNGFNIITGVYGDKEYSENTFSLIGLRKEIGL